MRASRPLRRLIGLVTLGVLPCVAHFAGVASGDADETERRLKAVGIDGPLREKIHRAIDRGVAFLVKRQQADGWFAEHADTDMIGASTNQGVTLLCTLALRHAGTPPTEPAIAKAMAALFADKRKAITAIETHVYDAGLAMMLFAAIHGHEAATQHIASALVRGLDETSKIWGYDTLGTGDEAVAGAAAGSNRRSPNLSTAQFAALGLAAARRMNIAVPPGVWIRHAEGLCALQTSNGSWLYGLDKTPNQAPTCTNTYMGLANLLLAERALKGAKDVPTELPPKLNKAIERAREALARGAVRTLAAPRSMIANVDDDRLAPTGLGSLLGNAAFGDRGPAHPGVGAYYTLYALEKACIFGDVESFDVPEPAAKNAKPGAKPKMAKLSWYVTGAKWLLSAQRDDGGWPPNAGEPRGDKTSEIDTALALLFLLRSPSVFHPTTPSEVDAKPRASVTESDPKTPPK